MFFLNSSLGRNGARSSRGGLTSVPSGSLFVLLLGSHTWSVSVKISQLFMRRISGALCIQADEPRSSAADVAHYTAIYRYIQGSYVHFLS